MEILIIVFAVSLAQFLERQREQSVKQREVKEFLTGLKSDMKSDVEQAKDHIQFYNNSKIVYTYLSHLDPRKKPNADSLNTKINQINSNTFLRPSISRFEGFKSSGKLQDIEDKQLLQNLLTYYEQALPQLKLSESAWINAQSQLSELFIERQVI